MTDNALDRPWTAGSLLVFALPTMAMMVFMGLYTITDILFVARFVNTDALSAINIVCPVINLTVGLGTMLAAGGSAILSRKMGEGRLREAREDLSLLVLAGAAVGGGLLLGGSLFLEEIIRALGASPRLFPYCQDYLSVLLLFLPAGLMQTLFSNLFVTAGRPGLGFGLSALAGLGNLLLDYLFIVPGGLGIRGAALGTGFGYLLPTAAGLVFFWRNRGPLSFARPRLRWRVVGESCWNGSSEMVSQLAAAVTTFLFNRAMLGLLGEDGVAAITILIYSQFLLNTLYIGFSMGVAPVFGYCFGKGDKPGQRKLLKICLWFLGAVSLGVFAAARMGGPLLAGLFAGANPRVGSIATEGFALFSWSFLFCGINGFASALFTALSRGRLSAVLSFLRTFGLLAGGLLVLPELWGVTGVWLAVPLAEGSMFLVSAACLKQYWDSL